MVRFLARASRVYSGRPADTFEVADHMMDRQGLIEEDFSALKMLGLEMDEKEGPGGSQKGPSSELILSTLNTGPREVGGCARGCLRS